VLCTHNHIDHLNLDTLLPLAKANPLARFVVPAPWKNLLTQAGIDENRVMAAKTGKTIVLQKDTGRGSCASVSLVPVPAIHTRYVQDDGEKDSHGNYTSLGFVIMADGIKIYHSGDTWITPLLVSTLKTIGPLDIAMLPINGTDWERTMQNYIGNAGPLDAVKLAQAIPIDLVIPAHYDMIAGNSENPARFVDSMYALCPQKRFHVFAMGERFIYRKG
jgi:L-ascorbate metabolism protein UlaG (beta-lactamase superfamily)